MSANLPHCCVSSLASQADLRTTQLYDRRKGILSRNIVERISIGYEMVIGCQKVEASPGLTMAFHGKYFMNDCDRLIAVIVGIAYFRLDTSLYSFRRCSSDMSRIGSYIKELR